MSESWHKDRCKSCNTDNWYCLGSNDIDGTECYKCGHKEIIADWEDEEYIGFEIGLKEPTRNK